MIRLIYQLIFKTFYSTQISSGPGGQNDKRLLKYTMYLINWKMLKLLLQLLLKSRISVASAQP